MLRLVSFLTYLLTYLLTSDMNRLVFLLLWDSRVFSEMLLVIVTSGTVMFDDELIA